ncbi:chromobox protein homolog 1-like isoform X1 [Macrosteles quadrilineatus]|uniref:chromobox protein homolog 1-like isoform X1 n=1 Tax=Macrosteles quadrilineatus TaxID=74068 RepID=UPI0023E18A69|nr:chromobox protein homolog 1-like isoform X1 [Macrosteles quadrilineatus]
MVKGKKPTKKEEVEAESVTNDNTENTSQENGVDDPSAKKKAIKTTGKSKEKKPEENPSEEEKEEEVVENGEESSEKKKAPVKPKKAAKKEPKPQAEPARKSSRTPKPVTKDGDSEASYEVEKIIDCRTIQGKREYLVRWKGYSRGDDTWEEESDLNCNDLLQKFRSEKPQTKKRPSKSPVKATAPKKTKKVEKDYEVEEIVGLRMKKGKKEFKIRWKGYKESDDSWEPENHLSCQDLINKYLEEHGSETQPEEKKTPSKKTATKKTAKKKTPAKSAKGRKSRK